MPMQMAAALAVGAAGAVVGTRFAVTKESMLSEAKKQRYVAAKAADTQRVRIYDDLGALNWPVGIDGRIIANAFTSAHGIATLTEVETTMMHCPRETAQNLNLRTRHGMSLCQSTTIYAERHCTGIGALIGGRQAFSNCWRVMCRRSSRRQPRRRLLRPHKTAIWTWCRCGAEQASA